MREPADRLAAMKGSRHTLIRPTAQLWFQNPRAKNNAVESSLGRLNRRFFNASTMRGKPSIAIPDDARKQAAASIQRYFADNLDQDIGDLKAALILEYFLAELGPVVYNKAIADAQAFFEERSADLAALCHHEEFPFWPAATKRNG